MSQFYDQASLVMVPSGYKAGKVYSQKPLSTDGELTFTRNSNATRIGPDGKLEKVRQNLLLQSNQFDTTWVKSGSSVTSGHSGYDGSSDAWKLIQNTTNTYHFIYQNVNVASVCTYSIYAKAGEYSGISFFFPNVGGTSTATTFNLSTGAFVNNTHNATAQDVGGGWYRISLLSAPSGSTNFNAYVNQTTQQSESGDGTSGIYIQNVQLEVSDFGPTDYIATTSAAVSVGPTANVPRLNYSNGCPSLLLEPQCSALNLYSEQINNAAWGTVNATVTANQTASPSGYVDADLVLDTAINTQHAISQNIAVTSGNNYTASFFIKSAGITSCTIRLGVDSLWSGSAGPTVEFNLTALTGNIVAGSGVTYTIEDYGNGWRRCSVTGTCVSSGTTAFSLYLKQYYSYLGDGTSGIYVWGANLTQTSYLQSYIPTLGASVTRLADAAYKTGISSLIGQTEGTIFLEVERDGAASFENLIFLGSGNLNNFVNVVYDNSVSRYKGQVRSGGVTDGIVTAQSAYTGKLKIALAYAANDLVLYINGVLQQTDTSVTLPAATLSVMGVGSYYDTAYGSDIFRGDFHQLLLFKTRLTNAQLAELTTL